ncbi:hypothetical protein EZ456_12425 [Pedobacter psychrodurus]|uniref:Lipoprotein n=1 Tax=Pedobacter psychrodurus TaxID=2530456 RepID=A0A4R0Q604_9SPHI|nr:hypothetical protein [Pedobacter psychrodurus]TCD26756.1 hypothetical protein EZ456_12425 [Pedobacter psychrodurus]
MKIKNTIILLIFSCIVVACAGSKTASKKGKQKDRFSLAKVDSVRDYLSAISNKPVKDTVIIKYDFNYESCWNALDEQPDNYIARIIISTNDFISKYKIAHPGTSVYQIKESGKNFNKLVLWNNKILTDGGYLRKNIFTKKTTCGTSLVLYPDGSYKFFYSDPHFMPLQPAKK